MVGSGRRRRSQQANRRRRGEIVAKLRTSLNALAAASVLAMALMTLPPDLAHAADNSPTPKSPAQQSCESRGYHWVGGKCADKQCLGSQGYSAPGTVRQVRMPDGYWDTYYCDGVTGRWKHVGLVPGTNPPAPPPPTASQ
jgi:hypothetical protein